MTRHVFKARHEHERKWKEVRATNQEEAAAIAAVALRCDVDEVVCVYDRTITDKPLPAAICTLPLVQALRRTSCWRPPCCG